jgi:hypothetical protein
MFGRMLLCCCVVLALSIGSFAAEIRKGATFDVKPSSIWFWEIADLTHWQKLKTAGDTVKLASYQDEVLSRRGAFQFTNQLTIKILNYEPVKNQVEVESTAGGRFHGSTFFLDASALIQ